MSSMSPVNNTGVSGGRKWKHIFGWVCKLIWTKGTGLDTNFFPNLVVGQPSNNINLSEIEIYLGMIIIILFFAMKINKSGRILIICMFTPCHRITVSETRCHIINHWCSCLEVVFFLSILTPQEPGIHFKGYKKCMKIYNINSELWEK